MSISEQLDDAMFLRDHGRYAGALTILMLAVAASSRLAFPISVQSKADPAKKMGDGEAFRLFLGGRLRTILFQDQRGHAGGNSGISVPFQGKNYDLAYLLYKYYRCGLIHEAGLPSDVEFKASVGGMSLSGRGGPGVGISVGQRLSLDYAWIDVLAEVVRQARCNSVEFGMAHYELVPLTDEAADSILGRLSDEFGTSLGRVQIMMDALDKISPKEIRRASDAGVVAAFSALVAKDAINGGALTGLRFHRFVDEQNHLSEIGVLLLRRLSELFDQKRVSS